MCEYRVALNAQYGKNHTHHERKRLGVGIAVHATLHAQALRNMESSQTDQRCFIASTVYGPNALETIALRIFRDQHLMRYSIGRRFVAIYYRYSPRLARALGTKPKLTKAVRVALWPIAQFAFHSARRHTGRHTDLKRPT